MLDVSNVLFTLTVIAYAAATLLYFLFIGLKKDALSKLAQLLHLIGLLLNTAALVCRGIGAGRLPLTNQYEYATCFAWGLSLLSLLAIRRTKFPVLGAFAAPVIILIISYAAMQSREVRDLMPSLRSSWLGIHVTTVIVAYGAFGVSFVLGILYLLREKMRRSSFWDSHVPGREKLDLLAYRSVRLGLVFLTFTMVIGAIWADQAWGAYWSWDPKETWALVTWLIYVIYLHLRTRRNLPGKTAAIVAVAGFLCVIFTYLGVNYLLPGLHSYA